MPRKPKTNGIYAVHAFVATADKVCAICGTTIPRAGQYVRIEPTDRKKPAFVACLPCGGRVQGHGVKK